MPKHKTAKPPTELEHKTTWATAAAAVYAAVVAYVYANPQALDVIPLWARTLILAALGVVGVGGAAYKAPHTTRGDVAPSYSRGEAVAEVAKHIADTTMTYGFTSGNPATPPASGDVPEHLGPARYLPEPGPH